MTERIVCFGDSITEHAAAGERGWTRLLAAQLEQTWPGRFEVANAGVGANTTMLGLDRFGEDVLPHLPAIVLIEFGYNDCYIFQHTRISRHSLGEFDRNLREIIRLVRDGGGRPVLIANHPVYTQGETHTQGNGETFERNLEPFDARVKSIAHELNVERIDLPELLRHRDMDWRNCLIEDRVHLNHDGEAVYADMIMEGLTGLLAEQSE
jgi:lysophospholipase L1-like esterase